MIQKWMDSYRPRNVRESEQVLREIMKEIALAGLYRGGFFKHAAFYGGTALRIFHGLDRFSEDLDFSLLEKNPDFAFETCFESVIREFESLGIRVSLQRQSKSAVTRIDSAFLKSDTTWGELVFEDTIPQIQLSLKPNIKIKLEIDTDPPTGFQTENRLLTKPFSFHVNCFTLPDLFARKLHALLYRKWKDRVKGRDWYDLEWYIRNGIEVSSAHFCERSRASGHWTEPTIHRDQLLELLREKIDSVNFTRVREDIIRFIPDSSVVQIWSPSYFRELIRTLKVV